MVSIKLTAIVDNSILVSASMNNQGCIDDESIVHIYCTLHKLVESLLGVAFIQSSLTSSIFRSFWL